MKKTARPRFEQEPTVVEAREGEVELTHPAFAQLSINRVSGGAILYDSDFQHQHYIVLRVAPSVLHRSLARDWHHASLSPYIEVAMSEAQFATAISSLNMGGGTPVTLTHLGKERIPGIPQRRQHDVFKGEVRAKAEAAVADLDESIAAIEGELGASMSQKKRESILDGLRQARRKLYDSIPFIISSAEEHMEQVVERGKVEVNAYAVAAMRSAGLAALTGEAPLQLGAGDDPQDDT